MTVKIALLPNLTREKSVPTTCEIIKYLRKYGIEHKIKAEDKHAFSDFADVTYLPEEQLLEWCDMVISIGGDGSLLNAGKKALRFSKAVLGVNAGNLAFLAGLEANELSLLSNLKDGKYKTEKRMTLDMSIYDGDKFLKKDTCINDVVLARGTILKMTDIDVKVGGKDYFTYRGDGLIVATPTGSTSYSLSAGGPVLDPIIEGILVTPICTHSLFSRTVIFSRDSHFEIKVNPKSANKDLFLSLDGEETIHIGENQRIVIEKSDKFLKIIRLKQDEFFDVLHNKLLYRRV
ncbi:MAG: NAD(+)/NADH kinase [Clostridia bacterium]|nr:NAD(+)/NADH kinase [Clostridia bacterium]